MSSPAPDPAVGGGAPPEALGGRPSYADRCPLRWVPAAQTSARDAPERVLATVAVLEESHSISNEDNDPVLTELQFLDAKLNMLVDMVYCLYEQQAGRPLEHEFVMSARSLRFSGQGPAPVHGERGVIELHLHPFVVKPLRLAAQVATVESTSNSWTASLEFQPAGEALSDALERHVFRRHRRAVAEARQTRKLPED